MSSRKKQHDVSFGQVTYAPDAPADAPTWIWKCECRKCRKARKQTGDPFLGMHGPFQTLEEAQADCEKVLTADAKPGEAKVFFTTDEATLRFVEENGEAVLYVEKDHKRIAKRYSGGNWIALEPGYTVRGAEPGNLDSITIEFDPNTALQSH
jgi:hypothetical protein